MKLQHRIMLASGSLRYGGTALMMLMGALHHPIHYFIGTLWLIACRRVLHRVLLPPLFPRTICGNCKQVISLYARWKCKGHDYVDHKIRHVLAFHCNEGHELKSFNCPHCNSTIQIQKGTRAKLKRGEPLEDSLGTPPPRKQSYRSSEQGILLGCDARYTPGFLHRFVRKLFGLATETPVHLYDETLGRHEYILGGTGMGKSTVIINQAKQLFERGEGATFLDPSGHLARELLRSVPEHRTDNVLYINVSDAKFPFPFNLLHTENATERNNLPDEIMAAIRGLSEGWGANIERVIRMGVLTMLEIGGNLQELYELLNSADARHQIIRRIKNKSLKEYWSETYPSIKSDTRLSAINKLAGIVEHHLLGPILCASECAFNADEIIAKRKIVIVNLYTGSPTDRVPTILGKFVVNKIIAAAWRRGMLPEDQIMRHYLFVDEFQNFMHRSQEFDKILSEARKYRLILIMANQFLGQLTERVRDAIFGNVGCLMILRSGAQDAAKLKDEFYGASKRTLMELVRGTCFVRFSTPTYTRSLPLRTPPPPELGTRDQSKAIVGRMHALISDLRDDERSDEKRGEAAGHVGDDVDDGVSEDVVLCQFA